jgi:hypothetical protein
VSSVMQWTAHGPWVCVFMVCSIVGRGHDWPTPTRPEHCPGRGGRGQFRQTLSTRFELRPWARKPTMTLRWAAQRPQSAQVTSPRWAGQTTTFLPAGV